MASRVCREGFVFSIALLTPQEWDCVLLFPAPRQQQAWIPAHRRGWVSSLGELSVSSQGGATSLKAEVRPLLSGAPIRLGEVWPPAPPLRPPAHRDTRTRRAPLKDRMGVRAAAHAGAAGMDP